MSSEFSTLSDFSWAKVNKGTSISHEIDPAYNQKVEKWESDYPTRTNISNIETAKEIIPMFGDSFIFCSGVPKTHDISNLINSHYKDKLFINLARCGSGNNRIITRVEQWANDKNSEKTKTIIIGFSSMYRFDYYMDMIKPNTIQNRISFYDTSEVRGFDILPQVHPDELLENEESKIQKISRKPLIDVWSNTVEKQTSYINTLFKNLETNIRRLDWITRSKKWNVIYIQNESWGDILHDNDKKVINKYLHEMDIPERRFKVIKTENQKDLNGDDIVYGDETVPIVDRLICGHFGYSTLKLLKEKIIKEYNGFE